MISHNEGLAHAKAMVLMLQAELASKSDLQGSPSGEIAGAKRLASTLNLVLYSSPEDAAAAAAANGSDDAGAEDLETLRNHNAELATAQELVLALLAELANAKAGKNALQQCQVDLRKEFQRARMKAVALKRQITVENDQLVRSLSTSATIPPEELSMADILMEMAHFKEHNVDLDQVMKRLWELHLRLTEAVSRINELKGTIAQNKLEKQAREDEMARLAAQITQIEADQKAALEELEAERRRAAEEMENERRQAAEELENERLRAVEEMAAMNASHDEQMSEAKAGAEDDMFAFKEQIAQFDGDMRKALEEADAQKQRELDEMGC